MTKDQQNKLNMYETVETVCVENRAITGKLAAFATAENEFSATVGAIYERVRVFGEVTAGKTAEKADAKDELIESIRHAASALTAMTRRNKNLELSEIINVNDSSLRKLRSAELEARAEMILQAAKDKMPALTDFGVADNDLVELKNRITAYNSAIGKKEKSVAVRRSARQSLIDLFESADEILRDDLDHLVQILRKGAPDFYNTYMSARVIKDLGHRKQTAQTNTPTPTV